MIISSTSCSSLLLCNRNQSLLPKAKNNSFRIRHRSNDIVKCQSEESFGNGLRNLLSEVSKSGTQLFSAVSNTVKITSGGPKKGRPQPRDENLVFVAGATGRLGSRIVKELLVKGFKVRGGVRSQEKAKEFLKLVKDYELLSREEIRRLEFIEFDLEIPETIAQAIGKASKVVFAAGASEQELSFSQPKRIDGDGTINLVNVAEQQGVKQFVLVTSLGTTKFGFPASILNIFGGILSQKARAERALQETLMEYTIIRPGGMERPTDRYKETHNVRLAEQDTLFEGQVSRLQIAELATSCVLSPELAENKVLEVVAEESAPKLSYEELLGTIESDELMVDKIARLQEEERIRFETEDTINKIEQIQEKLAERSQFRQDVIQRSKELQSQFAEQTKEFAVIQNESKQYEQTIKDLTETIQQQEIDIEIAEALITRQKILMGEGRTLTEEEVQDITQKVLGNSQPTPQEKEEPQVTMTAKA
eukprot:TRINITY_DN10386_c1_g1_i4.p2 TRINITY_DN10386_c1_g1~~TRINITY_DN10386_c1_g1_i4.p2  ORF type:complete len:486 (-),score=54.70 TRINITY_DN10386_c1_g1_i4:451-1884(-)